MCRAGVKSEKLAAVEFLGLESNHLYRLVTASGASYSLRIPRLHASRLTPFWQYMQDTFGVRYGTQLSTVRPLLQAIDEDGLVQAPRPVAITTVGATVAYIFTWVDGRIIGTYATTKEAADADVRKVYRIHG